MFRQTSSALCTISDIIISLFQFPGWIRLQKGESNGFDHNLDEIPLEIKSNDDKETKKSKYVWFRGKVEDTFSVDHISVAISVPDYSLWMAECNGQGEKFFDPKPSGEEIIWTIFKTSEKMVIECNGVFCAEYTYSDTSSKKYKSMCNAFTLPTKTFYFVENPGQVATHYRLTGMLRQT